MVNLEVTFQLGLAYSISFSEGTPKDPVIIDFPDTGNRVLINPPGLSISWNNFRAISPKGR